jgi:hypothetical protein
MLCCASSGRYSHGFPAIEAMQEARDAAGRIDIDIDIDGFGVGLRFEF